MKRVWTIGLGWIVGILAGCTVGPDFTTLLLDPKVLPTAG
jgi:hypothetical protein